MIKTNVMRLLDAAGIAYETGTYEVDENDLSGSHAADRMGVDHDRMYKTLVLKGEKNGYMVCCIPVDEELDLKKAAKAAGEKKVELIHVKDMLGITGYIRGGCSPVGMKKHFPTYYRRDSSDLRYDHGKRGTERGPGYHESGGFKRLCERDVCFSCLEAEFPVSAGVSEYGNERSR